MKASEISIKERSKEKALSMLADKEDKITKLNKKLRSCKNNDEMLHKISLQIIENSSEMKCKYC